MIILTATAQPESKVLLSWTVPIGTLFIRIYRGKFGEGKSLVASIDATVLSYVDNAPLNQTVQYDVEFVFNTSSEFSTIATVTTTVL
jgi:hypothetical protein